MLYISNGRKTGAVALLTLSRSKTKEKVRLTRSPALEEDLDALDAPHQISATDG